MISFCYSLFGDGRKIAQIGQTERKQGYALFSVTRKHAALCFTRYISVKQK